ncbi:MAG TPA: hypothetical protein VF756_23355 [Thermoanaerobaculia bacterium]
MEDTNIRLRTEVTLQNARDLAGCDVVPVSMHYRVPELWIEKQLSCQRKLQKLPATLGACDPAQEHGFLQNLF